MSEAVVGTAQVPFSDHPVLSAAPVDAPAAPQADVIAPSGEGLVFVRTPDGQVHAVPAKDIVDVPATSVSDAPKQSAVAAVAEPQFYVWLANGDVVRVKESDLPAANAGTNAVFGHWQIGDKVYTIVAIYPVEDVVKGA